MQPTQHCVHRAWKHFMWVKNTKTPIPILNTYFSCNQKETSRSWDQFSPPTYSPSDFKYQPLATTFIILVLGYLSNVWHYNIHWQFLPSKINPQDRPKIRQPSKTAARLRGQCSSLAFIILYQYHVIQRTPQQGYIQIQMLQPPLTLALWCYFTVVLRYCTFHLSSRWKNTH